MILKLREELLAFVRVLLRREEAGILQTLELFQARFNGFHSIRIPILEVLFLVTILLLKVFVYFLLELSLLLVKFFFAVPTEGLLARLRIDSMRASREVLSWAACTGSTMSVKLVFQDDSGTTLYIEDILFDGIAPQPGQNERVRLSALV
jgi:hypothetical protein